MCWTLKVEDKMVAEPLLEIERLHIQFDTFEGVSHVLDGVDFTLEKGGTLGLVGETGCGKSITAKAILRLLPEPPARIVSGSIRFQGEDLVKKKSERLEGRRSPWFFKIP
jgi:ABC-type dipeptide/oligopeptide/nickel transport system ATPase component